MNHRAMTDEERKVWSHLKRAVGRENALARVTLVTLTGIADRVVRDIVRALRNDHRKLVCYTQDRPGGYFIPTCLEDLEECRNIEGAREAHVRENRQSFDTAIKAASNEQIAMDFAG